MANFFPGLSPKLVLLAPLLLGLVLSSGTPGWAQERSWRVGKWSGPVTLRTAAGTETDKLDGAVVAPGDRVTTGAGGRVMMTRGADTVVMSENSELEVPLTEKEGVTPTILQPAGTLTFDIEPRPVQHFIVETPHLAAVVKGTAFVVRLDGRASRVDVTRGTVEVADMRSGQYASIEANRYATSSEGPTPGLLIGGEGPLPLIRQAPPRKPTLLTATNEAAPAPAPAPAPVRSMAPPPVVKLDPPPPQGVLQAITAHAKSVGTSLGLPSGFADGITDMLVLAVIAMGGCGFLASTLYASRQRRPQKRQDGEGAP
ncbi:MAG: FecR family protein [Alsobacter sp.]